jgi:acetolactate decarboxylase
MAGDLAGRVDLRTLEDRPHLYALGPLEGCRGAVSIFAGVPSIATVPSGRPTVDTGFDHRAWFLVSSEVPAWREETLEGELADDALVATVARRAAAAALSAPFPFRVRGHAPHARLHVLDKRDGLHLKTADDRISGHVESVRLAAGARLGFPEER